MKSVECHIKETTIAQGDLVLIINNERPKKSGFWRKIREGKSDDKIIYYILEKPLHKDFDIDDEELSHTHKEKGCFVMKDYTLKNESYEKFNTGYKYNILADIRGVDAVKLVMSDYKLSEIDTESKNVRFTSDFVELMKYYNPSKTRVNQLEEIANSFI